METGKEKNIYLRAGVIGLASLALAGSHVIADAAPEARASVQPYVSYELPPRTVEEVSRDLDRGSALAALSQAMVDRAAVAPASTLPITPTSLPKAVAKPAQPKASAGIDGYWFGQKDFYNGLLYKHKYAAHHEGIIDNAKLFYTMGKAAGLTNAEIGCGDNILYPESGFWTGAYNGKGGAYGIPQAQPGDKMAAYGPNWQTNATTQLKFFLDYVGGSANDNQKGAYTSVCSALNFRLGHNWY